VKTGVEARVLDNIVAALRAVAEARGWHAPALLVRLEQPGDDPGAVELAFKELDEHPVDALEGFVAPESWLVLGVVATGWAYSPERPTDRTRVWTVVLVSRDGDAAGCWQVQGGPVHEGPPEHGELLDCLRRAVS
jgi:hypothetical protein